MSFRSLVQNGGVAVEKCDSNLLINGGNIKLISRMRIDASKFKTNPQFASKQLNGTASIDDYYDDFKMRNNLQ